MERDKSQNRRIDHGRVVERAHNMSLDQIVDRCKQLEGQARDELMRFKLAITRQNYDSTRNAKQKGRDVRRLEKLMKSLSEASDRRQQMEALLLARAQNEQGVGLIEAALARKSQPSEDEHA